MSNAIFALDKIFFQIIIILPLGLSGAEIIFCTTKLYFSALLTNKTNHATYRNFKFNFLGLNLLIKFKT